MSKQDQLALTSLKNNQDITIKQADKGGVIVIQNTTDYELACETLWGISVHIKF